jgi:hypothetical protein
MPEFCGLIVWDDAEQAWRLTLYLEDEHEVVAVVIGSRPYLLRALATVGLSASVSSFSENWDRSRVTFVGN